MKKNGRSSLEYGSSLNIDIYIQIENVINIQDYKYNLSSLYFQYTQAASLNLLITIHRIGYCAYLVYLCQGTEDITNVFQTRSSLIKIIASG
jgi:hypothetical protein